MIGWVSSSSSISSGSSNSNRSISSSSNNSSELVRDSGRSQDRDKERVSNGAP